MSKETDDIDESNWFYETAQRYQDHIKAEKYLDHWRLVVSKEVERMASEGVDPYIARLAAHIATDPLYEQLSKWPPPIGR